NQEDPLAEHETGGGQKQRIHGLEAGGGPPVDAERAGGQQVVGEREVIAVERRIEREQVAEAAREREPEDQDRRAPHITRAPSVLTAPQKRSLSRRAEALNAACIAPPTRRTASSSAAKANTDGPEPAMEQPSAPA